MTSSGDRTALADFLRRRRADLPPADVGLPASPRRRTSGLRREDVAQLATMSTDYYTRLEQRRGPQPSAPILATLGPPQPGLGRGAASHLPQHRTGVPAAQIASALTARSSKFAASWERQDVARRIGQTDRLTPGRSPASTWTSCRGQPRSARDGGTLRMTLRHQTVHTVLGELLVVADADTLVGLYFPAHRYPPHPESIGHRVDQDPLIAETRVQLVEYLAGARREFDLPLAPVGPAFDRDVWELLRAIPFGQTTSYGALARRMGNTRLAQRVGRSVGHNPISIIVPCHRVVGADGGLTGFAGGLDRKRFLLDLEAPSDSRLF